MSEEIKEEIKFVELGNQPRKLVAARLPQDVIDEMKKQPFSTTVILELALRQYLGLPLDEMVIRDRNRVIAVASVGEDDSQ